MLGKDHVTPEKIIKELGNEWIFCETWIKKYPVCFLTHRHIDNIIELRKEQNIKYEEVEYIEAEISPVDEQCDRPEPRDEEDLQFSFQNVLGAAMLDGDVNLSHVTKEAVYDPRLKEARSKVRLIIHDDWPHYLDEAMANVPAKLTIKMKDGRQFTKERWRVIGSPEYPLTMEQIQALYKKFTEGILSEEHIRKTCDAISSLEELTDLQEIMDILVFRHRI
jgi:2-methylcitrate dehydratase PrpD